jgi:hypothetical protein
MQNEKVIVIGDVHGYVEKLQAIWKGLQEELGEELASHLVVFLGDLVDRGPNTKQTIDWMIDLKASRGVGMTVFLCGNHDFGLATFLGLFDEYPVATEEITKNDKHVPGDFSYTWKPTDEKLYNGNHFETMHFQGRRWGCKQDWSNSVYDSATTFNSYKVPFCDRSALLKALPPSHAAFFKDLQWIHESDSYIFVHAGLEKDRIEEQLDSLRQKRMVSRSPALCDRATVRLTGPVNDKVIVSGHHGEVLITPERIIWDPSGGKPEKLMGALILPSSGRDMSRRLLAVMSDGSKRLYNTSS